MINKAVMTTYITLWLYDRREIVPQYIPAILIEDIFIESKEHFIKFSIQATENTLNTVSDMFISFMEDYNAIGFSWRDCGRRDAYYEDTVFLKFEDCELVSVHTGQLNHWSDEVLTFTFLVKGRPC